MVLNREKSICNDLERNDLVDFGDCRFDEGCEEKSVADLLPSDPFGMEYVIGLPNDQVGVDIDISLPGDPLGMDFNIEAMVAVITGRMEDFSFKAYCCETDEASEDKNVDVDGSSNVYTEVNFVLTSSRKYGQEEGEDGVADDGLVMSSEDGSFDDHNMSSDDMAELMSENYYVKDYENYQEKPVKDCNDSIDGPPADALFFALGYLGVKDLLSVESVCKGLRDAVRNDTLLWRSIHIDYPLNAKITDDNLIRLTNRARGTLRSLSLEICFKITNNGLKHVLKSNLGLAKLSVPGCIKVRVEDILHNLKVFNSIKHLRIGDRSGVTNEQYKEFKLLLGEDKDKRTNNHKPRFYRTRQLYLSLEDERAIDVDTCPKCRQVRQVYDCPSEGCQENIHSTKACRACILCIDRCVNCGCCLVNKVYEETFYLDPVCRDCLAQFLNSQEGHTLFHHKASYHIVLRG